MHKTNYITLNNILKIVLSVFLIIIIISVNSVFAQQNKYLEYWPRTNLLPVELQNNLIYGINKLYSFDFEKAEYYFNKAIKCDPKNSLGYIYIAVSNWLQIYEDPLNKNAEKEIQKYLYAALKLGKQAIKQKNANSYDYLGYALAKMLNVRNNLKKENYITALQDIFTTYDILKKAKSFNDGNIDILFGLGLFNAYTSALPKYILKILKLAANIEVNVNLGIEQMRKVMWEGTLFRVEASMLDINIEGAYYKEYDKGKIIAHELFEVYPLNMLNNFLVIDLERRHKHFDKALDFSNQLLNKYFKEFKNIKRRKIWTRRIKYDMGRVYFDKKDYKEAKKIFINIILSNEDRIKDDINIVASTFRLGLIFDLEGKRNKAKACYKLVLNSNIVTTLKDYAQIFLEKKYVENDNRINLSTYMEYYIP